MVNCCIPWCNNYYENTASRGVIYHQIPKDPRLNKLWKDLLRRVNLPADESTHICSSHFMSADYDSDYQLREKLTGQKLKQRLKRDAVPSKFDFPTSSTSTSKKQRVASERRAQERARREVSLVLLIFYRNINSKYLRVCQSRGLSNVSRFHYDLYLYEKAYFRHVVPGKIKRESCFVLEKQHQHMAQYKIDISLSRKVQLQRFSKQRLTTML